MLIPSSDHECPHISSKRCQENDEITLAVLVALTDGCGVRLSSKKDTNIVARERSHEARSATSFAHVSPISSKLTPMGKSRNPVSLSGFRVKPGMTTVFGVYSLIGHVIVWRCTKAAERGLAIAPSNEMGRW
jgi:hypothetical protein